jgi:hypothetical protein
VLAGVASVAGQNRAVARMKPLNQPSSGWKYERFWLQVAINASTAVTA